MNSSALLQRSSAVARLVRSSVRKHPPVGRPVVVEPAHALRLVREELGHVLVPDLDVLCRRSREEILEERRAQTRAEAGAQHPDDALFLLLGGAAPSRS